MNANESVRSRELHLLAARWRNSEIDFDGFARIGDRELEFDV